MFTKITIQLLGCCAFLSAIAAHAETTTPTTNTPIINIPTEKLEWATSKEGVGFAPLVGDRFLEPYMAMVKLPAGLVSPQHTKTANMFGVVVSGTVSHIAAGADPSSELLLPAGSFYKIPKNLPHISKCISKNDCITFLYQDGKFDFLPVAQ